MHRKLESTKAKKGIASFYVVIFATLLLSVIVVSFVRIIISETSQNTNNDLSQSAYDSALVGIEDAKTAILKCYNAHSSDTSQCSYLFTSKCNAFAKDFRATDENGAVLIQTDTNGSNNNTEEQAYTCVIVNNSLDDYRSSLNSSTTSRLVDLSSTKGIKYITIKWYPKSDNDETSFESGNFPISSEVSDVPALIAQVIQANSDASSNSGNDLGSDLGDGVGQATVVLLPVYEGGQNSIGEDKMTAAGNDEEPNSAYKITCDSDKCETTLALPKATNDQLYLRLSLPYSSQSTDFAVELQDESKNRLAITDVQFSIDSTGRANDLYRRVETRVELGDPPAIPEYAIDINEGGLTKNFYTTKNCWTTWHKNSDGSGYEGNATECSNYGNL